LLPGSILEDPRPPSALAVLREFPRPLEIPEPEEEKVRTYAQRAVQSAPDERGDLDAVVNAKDQTISQLRERVGGLEKGGRERDAERANMQVQIVHQSKELAGAKEQIATLVKDLEEKTKQIARLREAMQTVHRVTLEHVLQSNNSVDSL